MGSPRVREEIVNAVLAELLSGKVGEWFSATLGEAILVTPRRKYPDIYFVEYYGIKIIFEAKVGFSNLKEAKEKCKKRVEEGIADICFAVAYDENVTYVSTIEDVRGKLSITPLKVAVISIANIDGIDLNEVKLDEIVSVLEKHRIYDELVSKEIAIEIADKLRAVLNSIANRVPQQVLRNIADIAEQKLKLISVSKTESDEEE